MEDARLLGRWQAVKTILSVIFFAMITPTIMYVLIKFRILERGVDYIDKNDLGPWGGVIYICMFVICSVFLLPMTPLEAAAGIIWSDSYVTALLFALTGKNAGSWVCFLLASRSISCANCSFSDSKPPRILVALKKVVKQKPHFLTALVCAAYIPASIKNFGLGSIPEVKFFRHFVPWTALMGLPYAAANVAVGMSAQSFSNLDENSATTKVLMGVFAGATLFGLAALGYYTKRQLEVQIGLLSGEGDDDDDDGSDKEYYGSI
ncbi:hypothetical protein TrCOL_g496 [Triparma columacea]|uniref:SNARE associated Golgi protein n=1 Tax=Triparma columacea TaxID=722753 RepID=A0A9W7LA62_9STRA|nr:hypothetical protein TrCOL_g496 [Triparma columacea]